MELLKIIGVIIAIAIGVPILLFTFICESKWTTIALAIIVAGVIITSAINKKKK